MKVTRNHPARPDVIRWVKAFGVIVVPGILGAMTWEWASYFGSEDTRDLMAFFTPWITVPIFFLAPSFFTTCAYLEIRHYIMRRNDRLIPSVFRRVKRGQPMPYS